MCVQGCGGRTFVPHLSAHPCPVLGPGLTLRKTDPALSPPLLVKQVYPVINNGFQMVITEEMEWWGQTDYFYYYKAVWRRGYSMAQPLPDQKS